MRNATIAIPNPRGRAKKQQKCILNAEHRLFTPSAASRKVASWNKHAARDERRRLAMELGRNLPQLVTEWNKSANWNNDAGWSI
jgi:hypothetical protein